MVASIKPTGNGSALQTTGEDVRITLLSDGAWDGIGHLFHFAGRTFWTPVQHIGGTVVSWFDLDRDGTPDHRLTHRRDLLDHDGDGLNDAVRFAPCGVEVLQVGVGLAFDLLPELSRVAAAQHFARL